MRKDFVCAACDFGASSGRVMTGRFDGERLTVSQAGRFVNSPVVLGTEWYWDFPRLFTEMCGGLEKCGPDIASIGIDTWGVDFGLLDKEGRLLGNPMSYRDPGNESAMEEVHGLIGAEEMYHETGIANMPLNTVYQLYRLSRRGRLEGAGTLLMLPDLFGYFLTGEKSNEATAAGSSQMMKGHGWNQELIARLGLPARIFSADIISAGQPKGMAAVKSRINGVQVVAVPGHDTACAVSALAGFKDNEAFLSSGTWSLLGTCAGAPITVPEGMEEKYSNYLDVRGGYMLLKDIMGMWLVNRCKAVWEKADDKIGFAEITREAQKAEAFRAFIDPDQEVFFAAEDMPAAITANCGGKPPRTVGETARCIFESLALKYRNSIEKLERITGRSFETIRMMGGGIQNEFLCQCVADATGKPCVCGPVEATAIGNILAQLIAAGEAADWSEAGNILGASFPAKEYLPGERRVWEDAYGAYADYLKAK